MHWSWAELDALPAHLYPELVDWLNRTDDADS
jgi:hypothetical protein